MAAEVARQYRLEMQDITALTPIDVTAATQANPVAITTDGPHGATTGAIVFVTSEGMFEVDKLAARATVTDATHLTLDRINGAGFGNFQSGSLIVAAANAWQTIGDATSIDFGSTSADTQSARTLLDVTDRLVPGTITQSAITVDLFVDLSSAVQDAINDAAYAGKTLLFRATRQSGQRKIWAGSPSTISERAQAGQLITGSFSIVPQSPRIVSYA